MSVQSWFIVTLHCTPSLSLYTVHVHCQCCHCLRSLYMVHYILALHAVTAHCTLPLHIVTIHCHCTLSLYTVHYTLYSVHCTPQGLIECISTHSTSATTTKTLY